jgi:hypothetical protein
MQSDKIRHPRLFTLHFSFCIGHFALFLRIKRRGR